MVHDNVLCVLPILDGKVLDINVARALGRDLRVDHVDSRHIVFVDRSRTSLRKAKLAQDSAKVASMLGGDNSSEKFRFGGAGGGNALGLGAVRDNTT